MPITRWLAAALVVAGVLLESVPASAQAQDLTRLSREDLLNTEITSVSRKEQTLSRTAAAVYVITQEDIRRSGATTIPDLLRMAPGFTVGQIDASLSAVSARGFNGLYANKLLVLVDGRSLYSPMFGGVYWEMQNTPLSQIERIELIRGPGGTVWGANAVNGVVNIITKTADATPGGEVTVGAGGQQRGLSEARYGGRAGANGYYRVFGRYSNRHSDGDAVDAGHASLAGARFDWRNDSDRISIDGSIQNGSAEHQQRFAAVTAPFTQVVQVPVEFTEGNVNVAWSRSTSSRSERSVHASVQGYRREFGGIIERSRIGDIEARQRVAIGRRHELVGEVGYRFLVTNLDEGSTFNVTFANPRESRQLLTAFIQDEIELGKGVRIAPGSKFEHNDYTRFEVQPSIRGTWTPRPNQAIWVAVSRAVRTPSKLDRDLRALSAVVPGGPVLAGIVVEGTHAYQSEDLDAFKAGYRLQYKRASIDVAGFVNGYDGLKGLRPGEPRGEVFDGVFLAIVPLTYANVTDLTVRGVELSGTLRLADWWKASGSYARLHLKEAADGVLRDTLTDGETPEHQFHLRTFLDLPAGVEASALYYRASALDSVALPRSQKLDLRLAWRATRRFEVAATAQNLLHDGNLESTDPAAPFAIPVSTNVFGSVIWRF